MTDITPIYGTATGTATGGFTYYWPYTVQPTYIWPDTALTKRVEALEQRTKQLERQIKGLNRENRRLRQRVESLESVVIHYAIREISRAPETRSH